MMESKVEGFRLSSQQAHLWLLQRQDDAPAYRSQCAVLIEGSLDEALLQEAIEKLVAKYEILRTTFRHRPGLRIPFQVIGDDSRPSWQSIDLRGVSQQEQETEVEKIFTQEGRREFDLMNGPVLHVCLAALSAAKHVMLLSLPALCADARSLEMMIEEIAAFYDGAEQDLDEDETLQYADFAEWQHELLTGEEARGGEAYWQRHLAGIPADLILPGERKRAGEASFEPDLVTAVIEGDLLEGIRANSRELQTTPDVLLLACWQALLWRLTGQPEILVGYLSAGSEELPSSIGPFARWLPVRGRLDGSSQLGELASQLDEATREARQWQEMFEWPKDRAAGGHLHPASLAIAFEYESEPPCHRAGELKFSLLRKEVCSDRFKVKLRCVERESSLLTELHFDAGSLDIESAELLAERFKKLVESFVERPGLELARLEALGEDERRRLLVEVNDTRRPYDNDLRIHRMFEQQVERDPDATALVFEQQRLTYAELNRRANQLAHYLQELGVGPEVAVGLCVDRSAEMIVGMLGIMKAGGAYVPIEPTQPQERLRFILEDVRAPLILTQQKFAERLSGQRAQVLLLDTDWDRVAPQRDDNPESMAGGRNLVYVIFTSGSTGMPKGVAVEHRQLVNYVNAVTERLALPTNSSYAFVSTFAADLGNTMLFPALCGGGCLHVISQERASDPANFADYFDRHQIDCLKIVPSHLQSLLTWPQPRQVLPRKRLVLGGEASSREMVELVKSLVPECEVYNHYGPTETTVGVITHHVTGEDETERSMMVPLGRPLSNTEVYVLDSHRQPVAVGVPGELYIGGAGVARSYLRRADLTAEKFIPDPFGTRPGARLYKTGDLARFRPDGNLEFAGRADNQIKFHGFRVELDEIRAALNKHTDIKDSVVVTRTDESGRAVLVAYYASRREVERADLRRFLSASIIEETIPNVFVHLKQLPLTLNGKIDYDALPAPQEARPTAGIAFAAPRTKIERALADIWGQALRVEKIGIHDNFFELGGDSILSIQIISRANQAGLRFTPNQIFQHQTIAELASVAGQTMSIHAEQGTVTGDVPLTPIQRWFFERELPEPHYWNQAMTLELRQPVNIALLRTALDALVDHHDALRLRFVRGADGWRQFNAEREEAEMLSRVDLAALGAEEQTKAIDEQVAGLQASLNLSEGPLLRARLFDLGAGRPEQLQIVIHHLVVDGVSWRLLLEDLETAYQQLSVGQAIALPPKTTSFKQWAEKLEEYVRSEELKGELSYWLRETSATPPPAPLPTDFAGGANIEAAAQQVRLVLDAEETRALLQDVPAAYHTQINDALLAALVESFNEWTGARSLLVNMEGHGREDVVRDTDLSRTVGWFTTHFPVRLDLSAAAGDAGVALRLVKEHLRCVPQRGIGYGLLRYLGGDAEITGRLSNAPQAEVSFNYLGQFDQAFFDSPLFGAAREFGGATRSPRGRRSSLIEINSVVMGGRLHVEWAYSEEVHRRSTIERLVENFAAGLRAIIISCREPEAGGYTLSDFPLADMDEHEMGKLALLLDQMDKAKGATN